MSNKLEGGLIAGSVDVSIPVILRATADNTGVTGKAYGDATGSYWRQGGIRVDIPCITLAAVDSVHAAGGFKEIDSSNMPGSYRFDLPDAAAAVGADWVVVAISVSDAYLFYQIFHLTASLSTAVEDVPTVAEFEARTIVSADYVVIGDTLARVSLVDVVTENTDMVTEPPTVTEIQTEMEENGASILDTLQDRVTAAVALASVCTEGRLAELDGANLPSDIDDILTDTGTTLQGELDGIQTDTEDIQARLPAALSSGNIKADVLAISTSTDAADKLEASAETIVLGSAATGTLSTTTMTTNLTITVNDQYNGRIIIFRSDTTTAALRGQATDITDTVTTNGQLTFTALTTAPVNGDTFVIV